MDSALRRHSKQIARRLETHFPLIPLLIAQSFLWRLLRISLNTDNSFVIAAPWGCRLGETMARPSKQANARRWKPKETGMVDFLVGERLRDLRSDRNLSQRSLGDLIGVTFQQVQKYEKGTNRITVARLAEICKALGVGYEYFLSGSDQFAPSGLAETPAPPLSTQLTDDERALLRAFRKVISTRKRKTILDLVQEMAEERANSRA
jgi:transcriptional regulator with XRE-family HTH domain